MRLILDTDVVVAAMRSPSGASAAIIRLARRGRVTLMVSVALALEYEAVCNRIEHRIAAELNEAEVNVFVDAIIALAEPVSMHFLWRPQLRDPCDEMVLEAAINGEADALVTFNAKDFGNVPDHFGVELLLPREVIMRMRQ
ncbi:MAG: putative toxin-antitoxin system toxin component, PIN family [Bryobacteraceae bacterium]